jgi:hypothetical protein
MHRSRRPDVNVRIHRHAPADHVTLVDVQRFAVAALQVTPRIVAPGQSVDVNPWVDEHLGHVNSSDRAYRVRAVPGGDALVIQRLIHAEISPFCGLLITKAALGMPPRVLFDMEPLIEGSSEVVEACRMLNAVVQHASAR